MPYITENYRETLRPLVDQLADEISRLHSENPSQTRDGLLNFCFTEVLNKVFPNPRYTDINEIIGTLECTKLEYYRKRAAPYEDIKEEQNGPVRLFDVK